MCDFFVFKYGDTVSYESTVLQCFYHKIIKTPTKLKHVGVMILNSCFSNTTILIYKSQSDYSKILYKIKSTEIMNLFQYYDTKR